MESQTMSSDNIPVVFRRIIPAVVPALFIAIGYVDPGKWAATIEGGARFGFDLVIPMLVLNFAAILCQYMSARIGVVIGKDLAEICSEEYDKYTCALLGVQTEICVITSDLTMILGIAHGLNLLLGVDLFTCVFLTTVDSVFYPILATLMVNYKEKCICIFMAGSALFVYMYGIFVNQPEISSSTNGILPKLSAESVFTLMSLLGASVLPQNFYLHSALVLQNQVQPNVSKETLCQGHFFAIFSIFSCIFLASYMLMSSSANMFYNTGLILLTFQDALSLVEQVLHMPLAPFLFLLVLHASSQVTTLTGSVGGDIILHNFFRLEIPGWLHRVTVRIAAIIPAIYCVWNAGAEGVYQLLIFTQVVVALMLPCSLVPLFRIASSKALMDSHKMPPLMEFLALITFIGMLGLNIIFVLELIFGNSDWAGNLRWNFGGSSCTPYIFLLVTACVCLSFMIWLLATPLKSASAQLDVQGWNLDLPELVQETTSIGTEINDLGETSYLDEEWENDPKIQAFPEMRKLPGSSTVKFVKNLDLDICNLNRSDQECRLATIEENSNSTSMEEPSLLKQLDSGLTLDLPDVICGKTTGKTEVENAAFVEPVEKTLKIEGEIQMNKSDTEGYVWDLEQVPKMALGSSRPVTSEGPGSFRSLSGKNDDSGTGPASLSRLAGLGRAARRQLATILVEFWGKLYDLHGQAIPELKAMKLDILLGFDSKVPMSPMNTDIADGRPDSFGRYFPSQSRMGGSDSHINSSIFDSSEEQLLVPGSLGSSQYEAQRASPSSSLWSHQRRLLDEFVQNSSHEGSQLGLDSGERRYSSLRLPQASEGRDNQPATIHGYQIASYINRLAANRNNNRFNGEFPAQKILPLSSASFKDSHAYALGQKLQSGMSPLQTSSFHNVGVSGSSLLQTEQSYYDNLPPSPSPDVGLPFNTKKYHSLPDISGISVFSQKKNVQCDSSTGLGLGLSINRAAFEQRSFLSCSSSRIIAPLGFDNVSHPGKYCDSGNMQFNSSLDALSLWSRQPFEQFGVADKPHPVGTIGDRSNPVSATKEASSTTDMHAHLLKSLRLCILKLLKLEGSDWLFKHNDGTDEDLIERVASREKIIYEVESQEMMSHLGPINEPHGSSRNLLVSSVPNCGDDCVWKTELVVSFGVWCIHRILDLSLMESRPELWGKYTYALNHLQGIIDPAFAKPRIPMSPCFCLQIPASSVGKQSTALPVSSNGQLPPTSKPGRGKCTTASMLLDLIKDVEIAISNRKGRTGTAAGDVAFPKGKENLVSVLKRYKRRLSNKPAGNQDGTGSRKNPTSSGLYGS
ncbi:hypothetical protein SAY87_001232 [Trapa incisa]|uniref:Ethylene-insensitive protein 2 n=1 Tax=Trapa incisa TaxID=236973 RepID=A0AAN7GDB0_9MYRT|nr:hypothetical protein SAY87_001232 [Trapa incisa]